MFWPLIAFLTIWLLGSAMLVFMAAATPSTERVSNSEVLVLLGIAAAVAAALTLMALGAVSLVA